MTTLRLDGAPLDGRVRRPRAVPRADVAPARLRIGRRRARACSRSTASSASRSCSGSTSSRSSGCRSGSACCSSSRRPCSSRSGPGSSGTSRCAGASGRPSALALAGLALVAQVWAGRHARRGRRRRRARSPPARSPIYFLVGERRVGRRDPLSLVCLALGVAALFWAIVQPWWSFPFDALGETVSLQGALESTSAPVWAPLPLDDRPRDDRPLRALARRAPATCRRRRSRSWRRSRSCSRRSSRGSGSARRSSRCRSLGGARRAGRDRARRRRRAEERGCTAAL